MFPAPEPICWVFLPHALYALPLFWVRGALDYFKMSNLSSDYIIRIYRFQRKKPRSVVGIVEEVGTKGKKAFSTLEELWEIFIRAKKGNHKTKDEKCHSPQQGK